MVVKAEENFQNNKYTSRGQKNMRYYDRILAKS